MDNGYLKDVDEHNDLKFERELRDRIRHLKELLITEKDSNKKLQYIKALIKLYNDLNINCLNYTIEDEKEKQKFLKKINAIINERYKKLKKQVIYKELMEKAKGDQDNSWDDYKEEEEYLDKREQER